MEKYCADVEPVSLQPPAGFSDSRELSEAECDRELLSRSARLRHEELEDELLTLIKR